MKIATVCLACIIVLSVGCRDRDRTEERAGERLLERALRDAGGDEADVRITEGGMTIKTDDGEITVSEGAGARLPADFPEDVLVYQGASVDSSVDTGAGKMVILMSSDSPGNVAAAYREEMPARGWTQEQAIERRDQVMLIYSKNGKTAHVGIASATAGQTRITLGILDEEAR